MKTHSILKAMACGMAAIAAGFLVWFCGYVMGQSDLKDDLHNLQEEINRKNAQLAEKNKHKEVVIVTETVEVIKEVKVKGDTIIKEVKVYVPQESDDSCTVPLGFVSVYDTAIRAGNAAQAKEATTGADARAPAAGDTVPAPDWIAEPSGVPLSAIATVNAQNAAAFGELRARYLGLREWAQTQCYGP